MSTNEPQDEKIVEDATSHDKSSKPIEVTTQQKNFEI